jgi:6-phosphogluconolactonase (cycloisomerase 2 family)
LAVANPLLVTFGKIQSHAIRNVELASTQRSMGMVNFTILAGGLTSSFIVTYLYNADASSLTVLGQSQTGPNSSWISSHPTNKTILYAVNEIETGPGALQSFVINSNGSLTGPVDTVSAGGVGSAFAGGLSTGQVAIANYAGGNAEIIPTTSDPLHFARDATLITFPLPAGGVSHPHMALQCGNEVFVSDLVSIGTCIFTFRESR